MIPVYNCTKFLHETISSVISNKWPIYDMQIMVVDNSNIKTNTHEIVSSFKQGNLSYHKNINSVSMAENWNICIDLAEGDLIHILHSDDYVSSRFYSEYNKAFKTNDVGMVFSEVNFIDETSSLLDTKNSIPNSVLKPTKNIDEFLPKNFIYTPSTVVKKNVYRKIGKFSYNLQQIVDYEMWLRVIQSQGAMGLTDKLSYYRYHPKQLTNENIKNMVAVKEELSLLPKFNVKYKNTVLKNIYNIYIDSLIKNEFVTAQKYHDLFMEASNLTERLKFVFGNLRLFLHLKLRMKSFKALITF